MDVSRLKNPRLRRFALPAVVLAACAAAAGGAALGSTGNVEPAPTLADLAKERDAFLSDLAGRLDVSQSDLEQAIQDASISRIEAAKSDGRMTEAQAAEIEKRIRGGQLPLGPFPFAPPDELLAPPPGRDPLHAAAEYLGLDEEELLDRLDNGRTSLADVAEDEGKSVSGLEDAILDSAREALDQRVEDGELNAAKRDELIRGMSQDIDDLVQGGFPAPPREVHVRPGFGMALPAPAAGFGFGPR